MASIEEKVKSEMGSDPEQPLNTVDFPNREARIAELAYYKAEHRGFDPGSELDDWLEAERELFEE
ncbi:DUF2934 domain-containing protein [Methylicorpusculum sp.]|uniref:DUF2934 domain-containing protein n=1 Tax=Methylicorpusculum sp. TaxID=2713644 RepID=UPI002ABAC910|nr:DUF2934 domain-containing protein [Methylicorpusculum sp.]MDZ4149691.1 DUF2934 domain-containing protein [Methylicorpusculum sp.]